MVRRLIQLYTGLVLYGVSTAMFVRADLGADPWNVFHLGVARIFSLNIGMVMILVGALFWGMAQKNAFRSEDRKA